MKAQHLPVMLFIVITLFLGTFFSLPFLQKIYAATSHVVISEIAHNGSSIEEFVELYNPTNTTVVLTNWKLKRFTSSSLVSANLVASMSGTIAPHGYFLIAYPGSLYAATADMIYSSPSNALTNNHAIELLDNTNARVDLVGMGSALASESATSSNPLATQSIERKASSLATSQSMTVGGTDELSGNGYDTDNNSNDFVLRDVPNPQSSTSQIEPPISTQIPTPTSTPFPTASPSPTITQIPTVTPNPTSTLIPTPTITPTQIPTPTNTLIPTPIPTIPTNPTPTLALQPTPTKSLRARSNDHERSEDESEKHTIKSYVKKYVITHISCSNKHTSFSLFHRTWAFSWPSCSLHHDTKENHAAKKDK